MPKAAVPYWGVPREGLGMMQTGVSGDGVQAASTTPPIMAAAAAAKSASDAAGVAVGDAVGDTVGRPAAGLAVDAAALVPVGTGDAVPASSSPAPAHEARARTSAARPKPIPAGRATNAGLHTVPAMSIRPRDGQRPPAPNLGSGGSGGIRIRHGGQAPRPRAYESPPADGGYAATRSPSHSLPRPLLKKRSLARASPSDSCIS